MRANRLPSRPRHVRIYDEDWDFIEAIWGRRSQQPVGTTRAIRGIIHAYVGRLRAKAEEGGANASADVRAAVAQSAQEED